MWRLSGSGDRSDLNFKDIEKYIVSLCTGTNDDIECTTIEQVTDLTKKSYTASIDTSEFPNGYYYFEMYNTYDLGTSILYTDRFQLKGMDGGSKTFGSTMSLSVALTATGDAPAAATQGGDTSVDSRSFSNLVSLSKPVRQGVFANANATRIYYYP